MTQSPEARSTVEPVRAASGSLPLGRVLGVPLEVHWTFSLLLALVVLLDAPKGAAAVVIGLCWVVALFTCVVVHELAHCVVAHRRGAHVLRIVLLPIGGVSQLEAMPEEPRDEFAVAAVGPLTSLAVAVLLLGVAVLAGASVWPPTLLVGSWWARLAWLNLLLAAFNALPALPMDGGRMLRAWLARRRPRAEATSLAAKVARVLGFAMIALGVAVDLWLVFIGIFVVLGAGAEDRAAHSAAPRGEADEARAAAPRSTVSRTAVRAPRDQEIVRQGGM